MLHRLKSRIRGRLPLLVAALALVVALPAASADFGSIGEDGAILYDAPSSRAKRLFVVSRYTPVQIVVSIEGWAKVRDQAGSFAWVEKKALSDLRTVVVSAALAQVRLTPNVGSEVVFEASQGVALELLEVNGAGWARVRHRDGQTGYMLASQLWGL